MILHFKRLTLSDIPVVRPFVHAMDGRLCDYSIGGIFMWRDYYKTEFAVSDNILFIRYHLPEHPGKHFYLIPLCNDPVAGIKRLFFHSAEFGDGPVHSFCVIPEGTMHYFQDHFHVLFMEEKREWCDYLYRSEDLIELKGSKYSGKRNHLHQFAGKYPEHQLVPLSEIPLKDIFSFLDLFYEQKNISNPDEIEIQEKEKTYEVFEHFAEYGFVGSVLLVNGRIAALSAGEIVGDTLQVHIEKANVEIHGAYPMIMNSFARLNCGSTALYINREEDDGIPGLRASKESYHPCALLKKYALDVEMKP